MGRRRCSRGPNRTKRREVRWPVPRTTDNPCDRDTKGTDDHDRTGRNTVRRSRLGTKKLAGLSYGDIDQIHRNVSASTPYRANRVLSLLSKIFNLSIRCGYWVQDASGHRFAFCYYRDYQSIGSGPRAYLTRDQARRIASNVAKVPDLLAVMVPCTCCAGAGASPRSRSMASRTIPLAGRTEATRCRASRPCSASPPRRCSNG